MVNSAALSVELLNRACDGNVARGCIQLGGMYGRGDAVPHDETRAAELYARTGDERFLALTEKFHHKAILDPLAKGQDMFHCLMSDHAILPTNQRNQLI